MVEDPLGGVVIEEAPTAPPPAERSPTQLLAPGMVGMTRTMELPEGATLPGIAVPEETLGVQQSFFGNFNRTVLALPDIAINALAFGAEKAGLIDASDDPQENRNVLTRFFNRASFEERRKLLELPFGLGDVSIGAGKETLPATSAEKVAGAGGEALAYGATAAALLPSMVARTPAAQTAQELNRRQFQQQMAQSGAAGAALPALRAGALEGVQAFSQAPARVTMAELLASTTSGATGQAEEELLGVRTGVGDIAGASLPAAATGAAKLVYQWSPTRNLISWVGESLPFGSGAQRVEERMKNIIGKDLIQSFEAARVSGRLEEMQALQEEFRARGLELPLTPAEITQSPSLRIGQEAVQRSATGAKAEENVQRLMNRKQIIQNFLDQSMPTEEAAPTTVVKVIQSQIDEAGENLAQQRAALGEFGETISQMLPRAPSRTKEGETIRAALVKAKDAKKQEMDQLADELGLSTADPGALFNPVKKAVRDQYFRNNDTDKYLPGVIKDFVNADGNVIRFQDWKRYRDETIDQLSAAKASGRNTDIVNLTKFKEQLDQFGNVFYGANKNWLTFKNRYRDEYALPFERGVAYEITQPSMASRPGDVRYLTSDEMVARAFTRNTENARDFVRLFANDDEARTAMRKIVLDAARDASMGRTNTMYEGTINPDRLKTFVNKNREVLDTLGLRSELDEVQKATAAFSTRAKELKNRENIIKTDQVRKMIDQVNDATFSPDEFIDRAITRPAMMKKIADRVESANDPALKEAFKQSVWTRLQATNDINDPGAFMETLKKNERALRIALGDQHYKDLETATKGMAVTLFASAGIEGSGIQPLTWIDRFERFAGVTLPSLTNATMAVGRGQVSPQYLAFSFGARFINARQRAAFDRVFERIMYDEEFARMMAGRAGADGLPRKETQDKMRLYLFNLGLQPDGSPYEPEPQPEEVPVPREFILGPQETMRPPVNPTLQQVNPATLNRPLPPAPPPPAPPAVPTAPAPTAPERRSSLDYEMLFPNDMLGSMISRQG